MSDLVYKLRRGLKLMLEHVYTPIQTFLTRTTSTGISSESLSTGRGTFRLNLYAPSLDHLATNEEVIIPFILPPLQDYIDTSGNAPSIRLEEVAVGFDQMGGATAIRGRGTSIGVPNESQAGDLKTKIAIKTKSKSEDSYTRFEKVVWRADLESTNFQSWTFRSNPIAIGDLKVSIDQNQSYALSVVCPFLTRSASAAAENLSLWSLNISLKFSHDLVQRDTGNDIQNIPSSHDGARSVAAKTFTPPASDSVIKADDATGVSSALELLDSYVRGKYRGGYKKDSSRYDTEPHENILTDAGYEVIAVPMWGNLVTVTGGSSGGGGITPNTELPFTYGGSWSSTEDFTDRRIIPIQYPLTVHHVIAARNYSTYAAGGTIPDAACGFTEYVGVGIGSGLMGQTYNYQQVALGEWTHLKPGIIDTACRTPSAPPVSNSYIWELHSVPLIGSGGKTIGAPQGKPFFIGKSITNPSTVSGYTPSTSTRRNVLTGGPSSHAPHTGGYENFIEVRWKFQSSTGLTDAAWLDSSGNKTKSVVGFNGNWVYLICKKHLV